MSIEVRFITLDTSQVPAPPPKLTGVLHTVCGSAYTRKKRIFYTITSYLTFAVLTMVIPSLLDRYSIIPSCSEFCAHSLTLAPLGAVLSVSFFGRNNFTLTVH